MGRVSGFGFRVSGFGFRVSGFGFRVLGFREMGGQETMTRKVALPPKLAAIFRRRTSSKQTEERKTWVASR